MAKRTPRASDVDDRRTGVPEKVLLGLCLCILALRATYTEAPTAQTSTMPGMLADTIYSLTLSGFLIFAFVLWLVLQVTGGRLAYRVTGLEPGLILFALAAMLSIWGASDSRTAINQTIMMIAPIFAALLLVQILDSPASVRLVLAVIVALGVVGTYQCMDQRLVTNAITIEQYEKAPETLLEPLGIKPGTFQHFLFEHRLYSRGIRGFFTTGNSAASFAIMASFAALILFARRIKAVATRAGPLRYGLFVLLATAAVVVGLLMTRSKGGILAFLGGLAVSGWLLFLDRRFGPRKRRILLLGASILLLLAIGVALVIVSYGLQHDELPGGNSMLVRWQYWAASARMYADHPLLGVGPGNFSFHYPHYKAPAALEAVADPHNFLLSLAIQYGPLGLAGFLAMLALPLWQSLTASATDPGGDARRQAPFRRLALGTLLAVCACLLLVRPALIPMTGSDSFDVMLYEIMALYVTPVAALLIGFLLIAAPFEDEPKSPAGCALSPILLTGAILAVLLHNLIDFALFEPGIWMTFWALVACLIATRRPRDNGRQVTVARGRVVTGSALAAAALLAGAYYGYVWRPVYATTLDIHAAQRLAMTGRFEAACERLARTSRKDPHSPVPLNIRGRLLLQQYERASGKRPDLLEKAVESFREAVERNPADYRNYEKLAIACNQQGQHEKAYQWYVKTAGLYPGCERIWFEMAQTAEQLGRPEEALAHYRKAVEVEERYRLQFRRMYPQRPTVVSRLGEQDYRLAKKRIEALSSIDIR